MHIHIHILWQFVIWPWLAARCWPSFSRTSPQEDRAGERMGQDKDQDHLPMAVTGKTGSTWGQLNWITAHFLIILLDGEKRKIRNTFGAAPFPRLNCSPSFPVPQPSHPPVWCRVMWYGSCAQFKTILCCSFLLMETFFFLKASLNRVLSNSVYRKVESLLCQRGWN